MANIGGYRSPVDLGLARTPSLTDPEAFEELTGIYNAIHLLNEYLDSLRLVAEGGGSGQTPGETLAFNRFYVSKALQPISVGQLVAPSAGQDGSVKGGLAHYYPSSTPSCNFAGIALTSAATGENFRVGVGPATVAVAGAVVGSFVWGYPSLTTEGSYSGRGEIYPYNPGAGSGVNGGTVYPMPIGVGISPGYALIGRFLLQ